MTLLSVRGLHVHALTRDRLGGRQVSRVLNGVDVHVDRGEVVGLVGETGAGKSMTGLAIMGLLRPPLRLVEGSVRLGGRELAGLSRREMQELRGSTMALVVQSPKTALDPLARVGAQIARLHRAHGGVSAKAAQARALAMLDAVGIADARRRAGAWPHELSGGMAQRVVIAMALVNEPELLIADEPTTGLDVTVQAQILDLLRAEARRRALGTLLITHDLGIVAQYCDRVVVMYAGSVVEQGAVSAVFASPAHPYTRALLASAPDRASLDAAPPGGEPPDLTATGGGCVYAARCAEVAPICVAASPPRNVAVNRDALCHFARFVA